MAESGDRIAELPEVGRAAAVSLYWGMIIHTFALRWKSEARQVDKDRALCEIRAFQGEIPGLVETLAGVNFSTRSQGNEFGAVMKFTDRASLDAYVVHPLHQELTAWLIPLVDATDVDFEV